MCMHVITIKGKRGHLAFEGEQGRGYERVQRRKGKEDT